MTLLDALMLTGRLPADQVRQLAMAAADVAIAELDFDEASERLARARVSLDLLRIQFGADEIGPATTPPIEQGETQ